MSDFQSNSSPADGWIDQLVRVDELLAATDDTAAREPATAVDESVDRDYADCLRLLDRVRRQTPLWPGDSAGWQWLYRHDLTPPRIGRFEIRRRLGVGGFGLVFLAYDPNLGREVALKVPRLEVIVSEESRRRFLRESRLAAALAHHNIAAVFEAGIVGPVAYIATAYCAGGSISDLLDRQGGRLASQAATRLVMALAQAVQHAHGRGILHRDIKPSNVLLDAPPDQLGILIDDPEKLAHAARLVDFGLARHIQAAAGGLSVLDQQTRSGAMLGTPAYMAPEQIDGDRSAVTEAVDIYALGATLYCLLVGQPPFSRATDWQILEAVRHADPEPPSRAVARLPRDLDAICLKCLEKDPRRRYLSATELEQDLRRYLRGEPTQARRVGRATQVLRWCRRRPVIAVLSALLILALAGGTVVSTWQWLRAQRHWEAAQKNLVKAQHERTRAEENLGRVETAIETMLNEVEGVLADVPKMTGLRKTLLEKALALQLDLIESESNDPRIQFRTAQSLHRAADLYFRLDRQGDSMQMAHQAKRILELLHGEIPAQQRTSELAATRVLIASLLLSERDLIQALRVNQQAIEDLQKFQDREGCFRQKLQLAEAFRQRGYIQDLNEQPSVAAQFILQAVSLLDGFPSAERQQLGFQKTLAHSLNSLAVVQKQLGATEAVEESYRRAIAVLDAAVTEYPHRVDLRGDIAKSCLNFGNFLIGQRQYDDAAAYYRRCRRVADQLRKEFPDVVGHYVICAMSANGEGIACRRRSRTTEAEQAFQSSIEVAGSLLEQFGHNAMVENNLARTWGNLGNLYLEQRNDQESAERAYREGIAVASGLSEKYPEATRYKTTLAFNLQLLGGLLMDQQEWELALELLPRALAIREAILLSNDANPYYLEDVCGTSRSLSEVYIQRGQHEEALAVLERLFEHVASDPQRLAACARDVAACVALVSTEASPDRGSEQILDALAELAHRMITRAIALGFENAAELVGTDEFEALRNVEAFRAAEFQPTIPHAGG